MVFSTTAINIEVIEDNTVRHYFIDIFKRGCPISAILLNTLLYHMGTVEPSIFSIERPISINVPHL